MHGKDLVRRYLHRNLRKLLTLKNKTEQNKKRLISSTSPT